MDESVRTAARSAIAVAGLLGFLGLAAPSLADPGSPGVSKATEGVYVGSQNEFGVTVLGEPDPGQTLSATETLSAPETPTGATPATPAAVGDPSGLPFTGLAAPAMLAVGLIVLAIGLTLRSVARARRNPA